MKIKSLLFIQSNNNNNNNNNNMYIIQITYIFSFQFNSWQCTSQLFDDVISLYVTLFKHAIVV